MKSKFALHDWIIFPLLQDVWELGCPNDKKQKVPNQFVLILQRAWNKHSKKLNPFYTLCSDSKANKTYIKSLCWLFGRVRFWQETSYPLDSPFVVISDQSFSPVSNATSIILFSASQRVGKCPEMKMNNAFSPSPSLHFVNITVSFFGKCAIS